MVKLKSEFDEASTWAIAYSVAAALLTLGASFGDMGTVGSYVDSMDKRACAIADKATKRLKEKMKDVR